MFHQTLLTSFHKLTASRFSTSFLQISLKGPRIQESDLSQEQPHSWYQFSALITFHVAVTYMADYLKGPNVYFGSSFRAIVVHSGGEGVAVMVCGEACSDHRGARGRKSRSKPELSAILEAHSYWPISISQMLPLQGCTAFRIVPKA